jgi:hypothetical protein
MSLGVLDRPVPATPRLRRGFAVLARRSFSEGGKPGDDELFVSAVSDCFAALSCTNASRLLQTMTIRPAFAGHDDLPNGCFSESDAKSE